MIDPLPLCTTHGRGRFAYHVFLWVCTLYAQNLWAFDPFEFQVYGYQTVGEGHLSPQMLNNYVASGFGSGGAGSSDTYASQSMIRTAIELEYGLTDSVDFAYYLNLARPDGMGVQYAGSKFRFRGKVAGEEDQWLVNVGWYAELEWWSANFNADTVEFEIMPTFEKSFDDWTVIVNAPDIEKSVVGANKQEIFEIGYRNEVRYRVSDRLQFGLQLFGGLGPANGVYPWATQQQYLIPVVHTILPGDVRSTFGLAFGLTPNSDLVLLKANFTFDDEAQWD
jgi:hypothetical protein